MKFEDFTGLYPVSKTLRFEAKPVGATLENVIKSGVLEDDAHRARSYKKVKKLIDEYHKVFIDSVMSKFKFKEEILEDICSLYAAKSMDDKSKDRFVKLQGEMRKDVSVAFASDDRYKTINKKELVKEDLFEFVSHADNGQLAGLTKEEAEELILEFKDFTTYFSGFHKNRSNMYVADEKTTSVAYRLVNENLPRFLYNVSVFQKVVSVPGFENKIRAIYDSFREYLCVDNLASMFETSYYNDVLSQMQIDIYNSVIGGKTDKDSSTKIQGLNECINLYNQTHRNDKLPKFKILYKQILSDRVAMSWLPDEFSDDKETLEAIRNCYDSLTDHILGERDLKTLLESLGQYDMSGVFIANGPYLADISQKLYGDWRAIEKAIRKQEAVNSPKKAKETEEEYFNRITKHIHNYDSFSIEYLNFCITESYPNDGRRVEDYFATLGAVNTDTSQRENLFSRIDNAYTNVSGLLSSEYPETKKLSQDTENVEKIKDLLDSIKELQRFVKPLMGNGDESDNDKRFYGELSPLWDELETFSLLYDKVRNYVTRKPYSQNKIKLNFNNATLFAGWDQNKEKDNACIILRRGGMYYLGIMNKSYRIVFENNFPCDGDCYEKMVYKLLPGANKMLPKVFFSKSRIREFNPSDRILKNYEEGTHKKGPKFKLEDCHELIDFFKASINLHEDWKKFKFKFSDTSSYEDISDFYKEVEQQGYKITFVNVSVSYIDSLVNDGKLYLFQLYNKDFSQYSKGVPNMHTLYWKALFDKANLADVVYKLNGEAELFFRKKSIDMERPTHRANISVANKNIHNIKKESIFKYDLTKDRRYTVDKFLFHVPITMNFKSEGNIAIEQQVRSYLQSAEDTHVIGIDRGERHLLYVSVIDRRGLIKEQFSLNEIINEHNGSTYATNYHDLLDAKESERRKARQSWQTIENIKDLKEGYLSQAVHKIAQLMVKYHAVVVLEDLNVGFMRGRQKVEKQVYQKFEKMLTDKLNYLVDKKLNANDPGGVFHAYQLSSVFKSAEKRGKQSGFIFYIPAWNTSKIDPVTGFVNLFDLKYENIDKAKSFFSKFQIIRYNSERDWFEFIFDYDSFNSKASGTKVGWTLTTHGDRILSFRNSEKNNQWDSRAVILTDEYKALFDKYGIDYNDNLKEAITNQTEKAFFEDLLKCLRLTLQMRNSVIGTDTDFLISPVADNNGVFYDSRICADSLPKNADANGAYNIARKGLMLIDQIKKASDVRNIKFDIANKSWLDFAQKKPYLDE